jgi:hypothetical protein
MRRTDVDEVNVQPVNLGDELRQRAEFRFRLAPVVICGPIPREFAHRRQRHALGLVRNGLALGPSGHFDAAAEVDECLVRNVDAEGPDGRVFGR